MVIKRGDMYYADLGTNVGSEQNGTRPVVIIQNDVGNKYAQTAIIVPLTKMITNKVKQPTHCIISPTDNLKHYSVALTEQIRVIDKSRILDYIGYLDNANEQNNVINSYLANITGKKRYSSVWSKIISMIFKLVKEGEHENAA